MTQTDQARLHAIVEGIVQGVNFRYYTRRQARALLLTGWVRNRYDGVYDGAVEVVAEGSHEQLQKLLAWLHTGPPAAMVTRVVSNWGVATGEFDSFEVAY